MSRDTGSSPPAAVALGATEVHVTCAIYSIGLAWAYTVF